MKRKPIYLVLTVLMAICIIPAYLKNGWFGAIFAIAAMLINLGNYFFNH